MRKNMSELLPLSELRLLIILNGAEVTPRLNTLECKTWEKKKGRETQSLLSLKGLSHLKTQDKFIQLGEPICVLEMFVQSTSCLQRRITTGILEGLTRPGYLSISIY